MSFFQTLPLTIPAAMVAAVTSGLVTAMLVVSSLPALSSSPALFWKAEGWKKTDFTKKSIDLSEILSGGPPKDGIPSIDKPIFKPVGEEKNLAATAPVIGLEINGDARAYPLQILIWHEIVNDIVGGKPVTVTYCPLCNAAIVFGRTVNGRVLDFGTTGKLRHSDLVMYDRQTETWWQQFTGEAIVGAQTGTKLSILPSRLESLEHFRERHPGGKILIPNNPELRDYGRNPYVNYDGRKQPYPLYRGTMPEGIGAMERIVVVRENGTPMAVTMQLVRNKQSYLLGNTVISWRKGQASALDTADIAQGRDVGTITAQRKDGDGRLQDVPYDVTFAFVFHAFHPDEKITVQ